VAAALRRLGVGRCAVVGFSYGGFVAFRMAEAHPGLVASVVVTGSLADMTCSTSERMLRRLGAASFAELLLPGDVAGLRSLFAAGTHRKWWFPDFVLKDYLELVHLKKCFQKLHKFFSFLRAQVVQMMFNRKERAELLEGMVISDEDAAAPSFRQVRMQRRLSIHCKIQSVSA
jgi:pimeloyl-ACP methyl ester carboxylesterase